MVNPGCDLVHGNEDGQLFLPAHLEAILEINSLLTRAVHFWVELKAHK
jgi:hypothetical protein